MPSGIVQGPLLPQILQRRLKTPAYRTLSDSPVIRSVSTMSGVDHICTYIPTFTFDATSRFEISDDFERFSFGNVSNRFSWFVELNPQANPC